MNRACPGCGLQMPLRDDATYDGYYNASPECWSVYTEVLAAEYGNALVFGRAHQLTVDAYAVQHAGGSHPDKSVAVHLAGLHLVLERGIAPTSVPPLLQKLASNVPEWPHFEPVEARAMTVFDVALAAGSFEEHVAATRAWASGIWDAWRAHHASVAELAAMALH